jgi:hypothetical protein
MRSVVAVLALLLVAVAGSEARAQQQASQAYLFTPANCGGASPFTDVGNLDAYCPWIKQFAADGISAGCGGGKFCPDEPVSRKQMALLVERAMRGTATWEPWRGAYHRTLIVNPHPYDYLASGARLQALLAEITDASASKPYLVKLEPGYYDLGDQFLALKPFVDMEGSGEDATIVRGERSGAVVIGADNVEMRFLSIYNTGNGVNSIGIAMTGDTMHLTHVNVLATDATTAIGIQNAGDGAVLTHVNVRSENGLTPTGDAYGIVINGSAVVTDSEVWVEAHTAGGRGIVAVSGNSRIERTRVEASGGTVAWGIRLDTGASAYINQVDALGDATASAGLYVFDSAAVVTGSDLRANGAYGNAAGLICDVSTGTHLVEVRNSNLDGIPAVRSDTGCTVRIAHSEFQGGEEANGGTITCFGDYRASGFYNGFGYDQCP